MRSSWLRHGQIIEIGDVSKEEALQYLKLRTINKEQAVQIYELTSGRMIHLKFIADYIKIIGTLEGTYIVCYVGNRASFLPPLQLFAR